MVNWCHIQDYSSSRSMSVMNLGLMVRCRGSGQQMKGGFAVRRAGGEVWWVGRASGCCGKGEGKLLRVLSSPHAAKSLRPLVVPVELWCLSGGTRSRLLRDERRRAGVEGGRPACC